MTGDGATAELLEAMLSPAFYPDRPPDVELRETHISWVFLAGERVLKVKKPVVFSFLDYGTLARRRAMCEEEVRLNRRLAPSLYLGVRPIVRREGALTLGEPGESGAEEYAVEMRRFDEERTLARELERGDAQPGQLRELGRLLAAFHRDAEAVPPAAPAPVATARALDDNFETLLPFAGAVLALRELLGAQRFAASFLAARGGELERRARAGRVRDGHGDLRADHVLVGEPPEVFDCVEFNPGLRRIDVAADLAFLVMDLAAADRDDLAGELIASYRAAGGDPGDDRLLWFFACYRAWVRAKVAYLRKPPDAGEARRLADLAGRLAWRARGPQLVVICGGAASGKTALAERLASRGALPRLSSDLVRKELLGVKPTERAAREAYTPEASRRTYGELGRRAAAALAGGTAVLVDATFRHRAERDAFRAAAGREALFVECRAPLAVLRERAARRATDPARVSDAGPELAERQLTEFEPLDEVPAAAHLMLRTDLALDELADEVEGFLDRVLAASAAR